VNRSKSMLALLLFAAAACGSEAPPTTSQSLKAQQAPPLTPQIELTDIEVLPVALARPVDALDVRGEARSWTDAHMVRLAITGLPTTSGPLALFVGETRIREYGSWEGGLYFWVYDPELAARLDGGAVAYSWEGGPVTSLKIRLSMKIDPGAERVPEDSLFPNRMRR
jgi:hypothetical protein